MMHLSSLAAWVLPIVATAGPPVGVPSVKQAAAAAASGRATTPKEGFVVVLEQIAPHTRKGGHQRFTPTFEVRIHYSPPSTFSVERHRLSDGTHEEQNYGAAGDAPSLPPLWLSWIVAGPGEVKTLAERMKLAPKISLARRGREILWVWGAGARDRKSPQIHIDRVTGRIFRVIAGPADVSFEGQAGQSAAWSRRWPSVITFGQGRARERFKVATVRVLTPASPARTPPPPSPSR